MAWSKLGFSFGACALLAMACDDGGPSARTEACRRFCEALEKCDSDTDLMGCEQTCTAQAFRSDGYLEAKASCTQALSCNEYRDEFGPQGQDECENDCVVGDCIDDALQKTELSQEEERLCESIGNKLDACDEALDADDVARDCERALPRFSSEYTKATEACVDLVCADIEQCLDELADEYDTHEELVSAALSTQ